MNDIPSGFRKNAAGDLVAETNIRPVERLEDELVSRLSARAAELHRELADFRELTLSEVAAFRDLVASQYAVTRGGAAGNVTLTAFDGSMQVQVQVSKSIAFGVELQAAKTLIDDCLMRWSEGANANIRTIIFDAFQTDRQGKISTDKVLGLRRLEMVDETGDWKRAMDAISDAIRVTGSKTYVRFYARPAGGDALLPVSLDLANV